MKERTTGLRRKVRGNESFYKLVQIVKFLHHNFIDDGNRQFLYDVNRQYQEQITVISKVELYTI